MIEMCLHRSLEGGQSRDNGGTRNHCSFFSRIREKPSETLQSWSVVDWCPERSRVFPLFLALLPISAAEHVNSVSDDLRENIFAGQIRITIAPELGPSIEHLDSINEVLKFSNCDSCLSGVA